MTGLLHNAHSAQVCKSNALPCRAGAGWARPGGEGTPHTAKRPSPHTGHTPTVTVSAGLPHPAAHPGLPSAPLSAPPARQALALRLPRLAPTQNSILRSPTYRWSARRFSGPSPPRPPNPPRSPPHPPPHLLQIVGGEDAEDDGHACGRVGGSGCR